MARKIFSRIYSNPFLKNVSTLAAGTIVSQLILFASSPILTRLFSASDFGLLALFNGIALIAAILTTGRYEWAVGLPEQDQKAARLMSLMILLAAIVSSIYLFLIILLKNCPLNIIGRNSLLQLPIAYLLPVMTFAVASYTALQFWNQRFKYYRLISVANSVLIVLGVILNLVFGILHYTRFGLIYSLVLSQILAIIPVFAYFYRSGYFQIPKLRGLWTLAREYKNFPKYMLISDLSLTTSQQIVPIVFTILFNPATVGYFSLANRMLKVPSIVFTSSIGNVFRNDAIDVIRNTGNCRQLYISTLKKLILLAIPIYGFLAIFSPLLFSIVFGKSWVESGYFARIVCISTIFDFIAAPLSALFYVVNKQKLYMHLQIFNMAFGVLFIYIGKWLYGTAFYATIFFAVSNACFGIITLWMTYKFSKQLHTIYQS